jgi:SAM-dependent methyltransferase
MLLGESPRFQAWTEQTRASFDAQWDILPEGNHLASDPNFLERASQLVEQYTQVPASWFEGKTVLDAGCGNGRWAYVFCRLGAQVTAIDQSDHGLGNVRRLCRQFPGFRAQAADLLEPLNLRTSFDFVWSFGVLHHTGDTRRSFDNVQKMVKSGGKLLLMIYGEPEGQGEFAEINTYVKHRRATSAMTFREKVEYLRNLYPTELVHGYFDAISPAINDLHRFDEVREWLVSSGFGDVKRTVDSRNLIIMATRKNSPISSRVIYDIHADRRASN